MFLQAFIELRIVWMAKSRESLWEVVCLVSELHEIRCHFPGRGAFPVVYSPDVNILEENTCLKATFVDLLLDLYVWFRNTSVCTLPDVLLVTKPWEAGVLHTLFNPRLFCGSGSDQQLLRNKMFRITSMSDARIIDLFKLHLFLRK